MTVKTLNFFSVSSFVITSLIIIFIVSLPGLDFLRVYLIIMHFIIFYFFALYKQKKIYKNINIIIVITLVAYIFLQNIIIQDSTLSIVQAVTTVVFLFLISQISQSEAKAFFNKKEYVKLSKILLLLLPAFFISFSEWSDFRKPGLFMNPNITSHISVMILPFIFLGLNKAKYKYLAAFLVLTLIVVTASRSAFLAFGLSLLVYLLVKKFQKINYLILCTIFITVILLSMYSVDIAVWILDKMSFLTGSSSRLFYTGYNGRDILMEHAMDRFRTQPIVGLGFDGVKFEIDGHFLSTHNGLTEVLLKFGVAGSIIFSLFCFNLVWMISKHENTFKAVSMMSLCAIFSLSTNSSTFFVLNYLFMYTIILVFVGYKVKNSF